MLSAQPVKKPGKRRAKGLREGLKAFGAMVKASDALTRLSLFVFGAGCLFRGQIIKGLLFLATELLYLYYMMVSGWGYMKMLPTLGEAAMKKVFDESAGIYRNTPGDNSLLILLFGMMAVFVTAFILVMAVKSFKAAYRGQMRQDNGLAQPRFLREVRSLDDQNLHKTLLTLPMLALFLFTVLPLVFMILMAFTNFDKAHQPPGNLFTWVGFQNFRDVFWENPQKSTTFVSLLIWTMTWAFVATFSCYFGGVLVALLINKKSIKLKKMWRTLFVMSIAVPQFVSLMLLGRILQDLGALNVLLAKLGITQEPIHFLTNGNLARITVLVANLWVGIPYTMLSTTGILMNIPEEMYESARIDGANAVQTFFKITLPHMLFVTSPALITAFVENINNFNVIYFLTTGNPYTLDYFQAGKTDLLVTWLYKLTVNDQNYSLASTIGILVFVITASFSLIFYNQTSSVKRGGEFS
ncbi:MAG: sugar ABC transporter permease [Candidatus Limiplasma sp.]|nr:sugar ABC transporter permease [Candidatus Limiplasma sp.]